MKKPKKLYRCHDGKVFTLATTGFRIIKESDMEGSDANFSDPELGYWVLYNDATNIDLDGFDTPDGAIRDRIETKELELRELYKLLESY